MEISQQISDLRKKSLLHGVEFEWIESDELERPYRDLLLHQRDMTSTLARFHGAEISLKILQERRGALGWDLERQWFGLSQSACRVLPD